MSKTLFFFDSEIAKVTIPFNMTIFNDQRQWYYLNNHRGENVIKILISLFCDALSDNNTSKLSQGNIGNISNILSKSNINASHDLINNLHNKKSDISCDVIRNYGTNNVFNLLNKTSNQNVNMTYNNLNHNFNKNINSIDIAGASVCDVYNYESPMKGKEKMDNTVIYNANCKSPEMSLNLMSPVSYRNDGRIDKSNLNFSKMSYTKNMNELNDNIMPSLTTFESFLGDRKIENVNPNEIINLLKIKFEKLKDEEERIKGVCEIISNNNESILISYLIFNNSTQAKGNQIIQRKR
jgi:hypothetical protein